MADVFISYRRDDAAKLAETLHALLEANGFSVWSDKDIRPGENWAEAIEDQISRARCVLVLWSQKSVNNKWVFEEAALAREQGKMLPLLTADVLPPLSFAATQCFDIRGWEHDVKEDAFTRLVQAIEKRIGKKSPHTGELEFRSDLRKDREFQFLKLPALDKTASWQHVTSIDGQLSERVQRALEAAGIGTGVDKDELRVILEALLEKISRSADEEASTPEPLGESNRSNKKSEPDS